MSDKFDAFLAYNPRETESASILFNHLKATNLYVYFPITSDLGLDPKDFLASCKSLLILIGPGGSNEMLMADADLALGMGLPILPVVLSGADPNDALLRRLADIQQVRLEKGLDDPGEINLLVHAIRSITGAPEGEPVVVGLNPATADASGGPVNVSLEVDSLSQTQQIDEITLNVHPPQPERPKKTFAFDQLGVHVEVAWIERGWRLPVDALVIPASMRLQQAGKKTSQVSSPAMVFGMPGGSFYKALHDDLDADAGKRLDDLIKGPYPDLAVNRPLSFELPPDLGEKVLPFAGGATRRIFMATLRSDPTGPSADNAYQLIPSLVTAASQAGVRRLAIPLLGTGRSSPRLEPDDVARKMVEALVGIEDFGGLRSITILTIVESPVEAARLKYNLLTNNLAQALGNDEPRGPDLLGISKEVEALAETLLLRRVRPPISVGIMGGWGSGKSFVMHLMWERMQRIRCKPVTLGYSDDSNDVRLPSYAGHIYQIRFNAWTYAKSNLWASLMQTIFFELNRQLSIEELLATDHDPLKGGEDYRKLYESYNLANQTSLWDTLSLRKRHDLMRLRSTEKEIAELKSNMENARDARQKGELKNLGDEGQLVAVNVLVNQTIALAGNVSRDALKNVLEGEEGQETIKKQVSEKDIEELIEGLRSIGTILKRLWQVLFLEPWKKKDYWKPVGFGLFILLVIFGTGYLLMAAQAPAFQKALAGVLLWIPMLLPVVRVAVNWTKRVDELVDEYQARSARERALYTARLDDRMQQKRAEDEKGVMSLMARQDLNQQQKETELKHIAQSGNLVAYEKILEIKEAQAEEQRRRVGPTARYVSLLEFVQARQDAATYESQLGLMHQVKTDIDELTNALAEQEGESPEIIQIKRALFPRGEPRIVLYIDDLDRCPPLRVVEVLEAVQLLLSTPLFIVVLGIDTRYVTRALEKVYKRILQQEGDPSGLDYIEKIIQIPYRVRPISPRAMPKFLQAQMDILQPVEATAAGSQTVMQVSDAATGPGAPSASPVTPERQVTDQVAEDPGQVPVQVSEHAVQVEVPLSPEIVRFTPEDYQDLTACCTLINLTPRSTKRLVNVFKLIEVFWFRKLGRDESRPIKQTVIALLALSAAYPEVMREAFAQLDVKFRNPQERTTLVLADFLYNFPSQNPDLMRYNLPLQRFSTDVEGLKQVIVEPNAPPVNYCCVTLEHLTLDTFNLVCSFSFVGDAIFNPVEMKSGGRQAIPA
jgi:hypothetical protein